MRLLIQNTEPFAARGITVFGNLHENDPVRACLTWQRTGTVRGHPGVVLGELRLKGPISAVPPLAVELDHGVRNDIGLSSECIV